MAPESLQDWPFRGHQTFTATRGWHAGPCCPPLPTAATHPRKKPGACPKQSRDARGKGTNSVPGPGAETHAGSPLRLPSPRLRVRSRTGAHPLQTQATLPTRPSFKPARVRTEEPASNPASSVTANRNTEMPGGRAEPAHFNLLKRTSSGLARDLDPPLRAKIGRPSIE